MNREELISRKSLEIKNEVQRELEGRLDIDDDDEVLRLIDDKIRLL